MLGLITAHSCECDKFFEALDKGALSEDLESTWPIIVAPVHAPEPGGRAVRRLA
jgi:hypothetical protein